MLTNSLISASSPDAFDLTLIVIYLAVVLGAPLLGYWFMVIDIRAYLRALRGALIVIRDHLPGIPDWAKKHTPGCIRSLGLDLPCTEQDIKRAYRLLAEELHPDRGGDRQRFMLLQKQFEEAIEYIREEATSPVHTRKDS